MNNLAPLISAIIVNYKSGPYAVECIRSLLNQPYSRLEILVVDNASADGSAELLRSSFGERIMLIESEVNLGFGQANNLAASYAKGEFLLMINPDAHVLGGDFLSTMLTFLENNPAIGIVGPEIHEPSKQKYVMPKKTYPSERKLKHRQAIKQLPGPYAWILGACLFLRKSLFEQIGGFDPDFFLYGEDVDICFRVRKAGYQVGYCEAAKITHVGGASELAAIPLDKFLRKKRGFFLFCCKHYDPTDVIRIAKMSLVTIFFEKLKIGILNFLQLSTHQDLQNRKQKAEASRLVGREVLNTYKIRN